MQITNTRFLITEVELIKNVTTAVEESNTPFSNVFILESPGHSSDQYNAIYSLMEHGEADWVRFDSREIAKSNTAALLSTSGTTGLPKAAMISHYTWTMLSHLTSDSEKKPYQVQHS